VRSLEIAETRSPRLLTAPSWRGLGEQDGVAEQAESGFELTPQSLGVDTRHRRQRDDGGRCLGRLDGASLLDALCKSSRETGSELGVSEDELLEPLAVDLEQLGIAERLYGRRPLRPRENRELADRRARTEGVQNRRPAVPLGAYQPAGGAMYTATPRPGSLSETKSPSGVTIRASRKTRSLRPARPCTLKAAVAGAVDVFTAMT